MRKFLILSFLVFVVGFGASFGSSFGSSFSNNYDLCLYPSYSSVLAQSEVQMSQAELRASRAYAEAVSMMLKGDRVGAQRAFERIINSIDAQHAPSLFCLGRLAAEEGDFASAAELGRRAYDLDTTNNEYLRLLGKSCFHGVSSYANKSIYSSSSDLVSSQISAYSSLAQAEECFATLRAREAGNQDNYIYSILIAQAQGDYDNAISLVDTYQRNWGDDPQLAELKHNALISKEDYRGDLQHMIHVTEVFPEEPSFRIALADIRATLGMDSLAVADYRAAIELDTTSAQGYLSLSDYYRAKGQVSNYITALLPAFRSGQLTDSGMAQYFKESFFNPKYYPTHYFDIDRLAIAMITGHPTSVVVRDVYGQYLMFVGRLDEAVDLYSQQKSMDAFRNLLSIHIYRKDYTKAAATLDEAIELYPKDQELRVMRPMLLVEACVEPDRVLAAAEYAMRYAESDSIRGVLYTLQGDLHQQMGAPKVARKMYEKALRYTPRGAGLLNNYAYMLAVEEQELPRALQMAELANELEGSNPTFIDTHAWVLFKMERYEEARVIMLKALALSASDPSTRDLFIHYGDILAALGDKLMARNYWRKALEAGYDGRAIERRLLWLEQSEKAIIATPPPTTTMP